MERVETLVDILIVLLLAIITTPLVRYFVWRARYNEIRDRLKELETQSNWLKDTLRHIARQVEELQAHGPDTGPHGK